jgi:hypothetical protein
MFERVIDLASWYSGWSGTFVFAERKNSPGTILLFAYLKTFPNVKTRRPPDQYFLDHLSPMSI